MDEKTKENLLVLATICSLLCLVAIIGYVLNTENKIIQTSKDVNQLLSNDIAMANYIQANSNTIQYLNENCKQTQDNNETITLTCLKVKQ